MIQKLFMLVWYSIFLLSGVQAQKAEEARLLRFPHIHQNQIVFVYAGDLWKVATTGGVARRLTSHIGMELFPHFSPDGKWIAFSAEYSGTRQVYVMPAEGGEPRRLTFYPDVGPMPPRGGWDYQILDWTPDSKKILFRGNRLPQGARLGKYFTVDLDGNFPEELPIPEGALASFSPDGKKIAYNRISREFRTWKRYRGGRAQDVWLYDLEKNKIEQITKFKGTDNFPLWVENQIYFTSDRENKLNLYAYDLTSKQTKKVTNHTEYDVLWPSRGADGIVYENGGYIYRLDPATGKSHQIHIQIYDDKLQTIPYYKNVTKFINYFGLSPSGKRALFEARGDIFTVPAKNGNIRNLTNSQGIREKNPLWSPDGQQIVYESDVSGEYEIYLIDAKGGGKPQQLTSNNDAWRFAPIWSPDGKYLVFADKKARLRLLEVKTKKIKDLDKSKYSDIGNYVWSPDSRWIAFTKNSANNMSSIWLYSLDQQKKYQLTSDFTDDFNPVFAPDGKYFYFMSNRDFNLVFSSFEFDYHYSNSSRIYVGTLSKEHSSPFAPKSDEEVSQNQTNEKAEKPAENKSTAKKKQATINVKIDIAGFENRIKSLDGSAGGYRGLSAVKAGPIYLHTVQGKTALKLYDLEKQQEKTILEGIRNYDLSGDGKKIIYPAAGKYGIVAAQPNQKKKGANIKLDKLEMRIEPQKEWAQMYQDVCRIQRDWFYDPDLHGVDWEKIKLRYQPLVAHVATRADLDYIFGELAGELAAGHTYVQSGDQPGAKQVKASGRPAGLLGCVFEKGQAQFYRFKKIYAGENWDDRWCSPLTEAGIEVKAGDYLISINGNKVMTKTNPYSYLENSVGKIVTLKVNDKPTEKNAREIQVRPIASEANLRYLDWVKQKRIYVDKATNGKVGYIHLPNTAGAGNRELFKWFYPQAQKEGLIIDVRYNGGGFIPDRMIELVNRNVLSYWARRGGRLMQTPGFAHIGPKACIINGLASSGGDAFPYYFKKKGLGPLIGTRTWGGLIGISGSPGLVDGGSVTVPAFSFINTAGKWDVENIGVAPDIPIDNRPDLVIAGQDPQLEKAIEYVLAELKKKPTKKIKIPAYPKR